MASEWKAAREKWSPDWLRKNKTKARWARTDKHRKLQKGAEKMKERRWWKRKQWERESKHDNRCDGISEQKHRNGTWTDWMNNTNKSERALEWAGCWWILPGVAVPAVLTQPGVTRASASQGACRPLLPSCPHSDVGAGPAETETTQAFQSGTNRVYRAAEQPSSHSLAPR